jgi:hypothetical protein
VGRVVLHLTDDEFFSLTPRQYHLLLDQHQRITEHDELLTGIIASTVANFSMARLEKPTNAADFMPSVLAKDNQPKKLRKPSAKVLAAKVRAIFGPVAVTNG